jgi:DNA polymerase-3 subunit alpha
MDRELLSRHAKAALGTTGCPGGEVQTRLGAGQDDQAREAAVEFQDIFGKENFYCEIMDHGIDIERRTMNELLGLAKELGMPLVATNDLHYTHAGDADAHAALLCVQSASTLDDPNRFKFDSQEFYLKSAAEMKALFSDSPAASRRSTAPRPTTRWASSTRWGSPATSASSPPSSAGRATTASGSAPVAGRPQALSSPTR